MKRFIVFLLSAAFTFGVMAQEQKKAEPATPAVPASGDQQKAPAVPSPNAAHGQEMKAKNMEKRDLKKAEMKKLKDEKKAAKAEKKAAKQERKETRKEGK